MAKRENRGPALAKTVVLVGMMGAGKTAVGKALASLLDAPFRDTDAEVEEAANMSIAEIFERDGESFFRDREAEIVARLIKAEPAGILSTGGGAFLSPATRQVVSETGLAVWLKADLELLWERVRHKDTRPLLRTADPRATLAALMADREPAYAQAGLTVEAEPGLSIAQMAAKVLASIEHARPDVLEKSRV
ncbi:MAG: shikimate kinase [Pseudomonadota bacterium]